MRKIRFSEALLEAVDQVMALDPSVYVMGLGVPDPKKVFGTTKGLEEKYGRERVMDMPASENAMTGVAIGTALMGMRPIMVHQRVDFSLLALDQLINNAAKWRYMFGDQAHVPLVVRLIIGRGWGQGPQHSQTLHSLFAHIPGLCVVVPSSCYDAKGLLVASIEENQPVIFLEHRWLHNLFGEVPEALYRVPLGQARIVKEGKDLTLVTWSHMAVEAFRTLPYFEKEGVSVELIDLRTLKPFDRKTVFESVRKTGRLLVADPDWKTGSFAGEVVAEIVEGAFPFLKEAPVRVTYPDTLCPTSWALANSYYPTVQELAARGLSMMGKKSAAEELLKESDRLRREMPLDIPDPSFTGPF